jgi:hypothetical protein
MDTEEERIKDAAQNTEILRLPKQTLATFGMTNIGYYLVTRPVYAELAKDIGETVVREGRVIADKPRIVTPYYLSRLEGFSPDARTYFEMLTNTQGPDVPGLFYSYRNEPKGLTIVSEGLDAVIARLNSEIDRLGDPLVTIIKGQDELWDVSLMKFIFEMTRNSIQENLLEFRTRGLLDVDTRGVPMDARLGIEELFKGLARGYIEPGVLKDELERWNLFEEYQDRFFSIFRRGKS